MDVADVDIAWAQRDASPTRYQSYVNEERFEGEYERIHAEREARQASRSRSRRSRRSQASREPAREPVEEVEEVQPIRSHDGPYGTPNETGSISSSVSSRRGRSDRMRSRQMSTLSKTSTKMERDIMAYIDRHPTAIDRIEHHRLQHMQTVGSRKTRPDDFELPDFGGGKEYPPLLPEREEYVVEFSGHDDPRHAQNFPMKKKVLIGVILVWDSLAATLASSIFSAGSQFVGEEFHVGREVVTLGTSLFVLGYALGPIIFAPISELYGRRLPILIGAFGFSIFNTAVAVAKDYQTLTISRFFGGIFASCPLAITGAVFADMFDNKVRIHYKMIANLIR